MLKNTNQDLWYPLLRFFYTPRDTDATVCETLAYPPPPKKLRGFSPQANYTN
jgi:hypothetical protein